MSRKEVIKLLKLIKSTVYLGNRKFFDALEFAINYLGQPEQRWIPCSERLPEENLPVLVAVKQKDRLPKWVKEQTYSYVTDIDVYDDVDFDAHKNKVIAWMPLPEPYRGEKNENRR